MAPNGDDKVGISLVYFNGRGRAEPIRYIFAYAQVPYEDERIGSDKDWHASKTEFKLSQLPVVKIKKNGQTIAIENQSGAILRKYANQYGLGGKTPEEAFKADEIYESTRDLSEAAEKLMWDFDAAKKEASVGELKTVKIPRFFGYFETKLKENGGKFIAGGDGFTYADFAVASLLENFERDENVDVEGHHFDRPILIAANEVESKYPGLASLKKAVENAPGIKAYRDKRPDTPY